MKKLTILIDMDDTIESLLNSWVAWLNKKHGLSTRVEDVREWDISRAFPTLTREEVYAPLFDHKMWETVKPIPGAKEAIKRLMDDGHDIYITTSSNYITIDTKMEKVLFKYFPFIDWNHVIVCSKKQMIRGDVMVDDGPHNLINGDYLRIMMDAPHNRAFDEKEYGINRVYNWQEVYDLIRKEVATSE